MQYNYNWENCHKTFIMQVDITTKLIKSKTVCYFEVLTSLPRGFFF